MTNSVDMSQQMNPLDDSIYAVEIKTIQGEITTLNTYREHILLIVNVASRCGFTPQYQALEALFKEYESRGLIVLGFPCDQFFHQEPGSNKDIKAFVDSCFRVTFPMFGKIEVRGSSKAPLYRYLSKHIQKKPLIPLIPWNFSKILVDAQGQVLQRFLPTTSFEKIRDAIDTLLNSKS